MPIVGTLSRSVSSSASGAGTSLEHDRERAGLLERLRVVHELHGGGRRLALHLEAAELVHRLRRQADVPHHGDAGLDELRARSRPSARRLRASRRRSRPPS